MEGGDPEDPGGVPEDRIENDDDIQSDAHSDKGEASRPDTSFDVEMDAPLLKSEDAQPEEIQIVERDPSVHSSEDAQPEEIQIVERDPSVHSSEDAQPEEIQIVERDPSVHSSEDAKPEAIQIVGRDPSVHSSEESFEPDSESSDKTPNCCTKCLKPVKDKLGKWLKAFKKFSKPLTIVAKWGIMIMAFVGFGLLSFDQYTDGKTAKEVCDMPCNCVWNKNPENTTTILFEKNGAVCEGTGDSKEDRTCYDAFGNEDLIRRFCERAESADNCTDLRGWRADGWRHPNFCSLTITTIVGSSILTSTFLLLRLRKLYVSMLIYLGWNKNDHSKLFISLYYIIHVLWILQILPHAWIVMTFFIGLRAYKKEQDILVKENKKRWEEASSKPSEWIWKDKEKWDQSNRRSKIIFAIFEDTPQLTLHSMFIVNSAVKEERVLVFSGLDFLGGWFYVGAITSAFSMALSVTLYKQLPDKKDKAFQFLSSMLAVGSRAFICACYASTISKDFKFQTWTLLLPPATSFVLYIIDQIANSFFRGQTKKLQRNINEHADSIFEVLRDRTWNKFKKMVNKIYNTATSAIVSLIFEGNSVESLIPAYTYLAYAIILNTMWVTEERSVETKELLLAIQYLSLASVLINWMIVQWEGKHKVRCLIYSLVFLLFLGVFYHFVGEEYKSLKILYFSTKAVEAITKDEIPIYIKESLSSLTPIICIAVITSSINLLLKIAGLIRDCFIRALIPERKGRRERRHGQNSDIEMEALHQS